MLEVSQVDKIKEGRRRHGHGDEREVGNSWNFRS